MLLIPSHWDSQTPFLLGRHKMLWQLMKPADREVYLSRPFFRVMVAKSAVNDIPLEYVVALTYSVTKTTGFVTKVASGS